MTTEEIAKAGGMLVADVMSLSWKTSWDDVPFKLVRKFTEACGIDLSNRAIVRSQSSYIRRGAAFKYLKQSPDWEHVYKPMIVAYVASRG